jgi:MFS transporter, FSR family, fosmidomycin resistance protein
MPATALSYQTKPAYGSNGRGGFPLLLLIGLPKSALRMGPMTYLAFLPKEKGASLPIIRLALKLVFVGGAGGKFACGWLGARIGVVWTGSQPGVGTALCIVAILVSPLAVYLFLLPLLGLMLNGTSSALYGTIPELTSMKRTERAFALFYTATIGSGALARIISGALGDKLGVGWATLATAVTALVICPLAFALAPHPCPSGMERSDM